MNLSLLGKQVEHFVGARRRLFIDCCRTVAQSRGGGGTAKHSRHGLRAGIWTTDISKAHLPAKKIRAGTVYVNCYNVFPAALPFGSYKESGWGRDMGHEALAAYTEVKSVCRKL